MDFNEGKAYFKKGVSIFKLENKTILNVSKDEKASNYAFLFFAIAGLAYSAGFLTINSAIGTIFLTLIGSFVHVGMIHFLAKFFGGKGDYMELYRAYGVGSVAHFIAFIPIIGPLFGSVLTLWYLVVNTRIVKLVYKLSTKRAFAAVFLPFLVMVIIVSILLVIVITAIFAAVLLSLGNNFNL